nr:gustatory receptor 31 [Pieris rapae]
MSFEHEYPTVNVIGKNRINQKIFHLNMCLCQYKHIINCFDRASNQIQIGILSILVTNYPNVVLYFYRGIVTFYTDGLQLFLPLWFKIQYTLILLFTPAILSELISVEYEKIRETLRKQIATCTDECLKEVQQKAYVYVKLRPYEFVIGRAVSLKISMPLSFIGVCIGHLIVLLQNQKHRYENEFKN